MALGDRIEERLRAMGWSQAELARRIGVQSTSIWKLVQGQSQGSKHLHHIARELQTSVEYLEGETDDPNPGRLADRQSGWHGLALGKVPGDRPRLVAKPDGQDVVEVAQIDLRYGLGGTFLDNHVESEMRMFSRAWLRQFTDSRPEDLVWAKGQGNSMEATISDGDIVLIDRRQDTVLMADLIWAFAFGHIGMIKRLRPMPDGSVKILSDNPAVPQETAHDDELHIVGRVVAVVKKV